MSESIKIGACVYLMYNRPLDLYKIGYTTQMPEKRKAQIEAAAGNPWGCSINLEVRAVILCESEDIARYLEARLHQDGYNRGLKSEYGAEWFSDITHLQYCTFHGDIEGVWGWRQVVEYMELELAHIEDDADAMSVRVASEIMRLDHEAAFAMWVADNLVESVKKKDLESFWFYAKKRDQSNNAKLLN